MRGLCAVFCTKTAQNMCTPCSLENALSSFDELLGGRLEGGSIGGEAPYKAELYLLLPTSPNS